MLDFYLPRLQLVSQFVGVTLKQGNIPLNKNMLQMCKSCHSDSEDIEPILTQPLPTATVSTYCPPGLEDLLEVCQLVIHKSNFRKNIGNMLNFISDLHQKVSNKNLDTTHQTVP